VHKPSLAVLNVTEVRKVYACERDKIMMSSRSEGRKMHAILS
jgi:hypothetical protein